MPLLAHSGHELTRQQSLSRTLDLPVSPLVLGFVDIHYHGWLTLTGLSAFKERAFPVRMGRLGDEPLLQVCWRTQDRYGDRLWIGLLGIRLSGTLLCEMGFSP